jgi:hypothetical protein
MKEHPYAVKEVSKAQKAIWEESGEYTEVSSHVSLHLCLTFMQNLCPSKEG